VRRIDRILFVLALSCLSTAPSLAQSRICLIDIGKVFKANTGFNEQMAKLKAEADQFQISLQQAQQQITVMSEQLRQLNAATDEYQTKENEIAQLSAKWEVDRRSRVREMMQRESELHYQTYVQINDQISQYAAETGTAIVLRFSSEPMDLADPETIMQAFNNTVVYYAPPRDITDRIIERMASAPPAVSR
jgi:Skp family chaperone for outer membrane proteins